MAELRDLLIEIGTEELPPKALRQLAEAFAAHVRAGLAEAQLEMGDFRWYATPRRLAVLVRNLTVHQGDQVLEKRGPALTAAFDDNGMPTKAADGFARSCGVAVEELERMETAKGAWLVFRTLQKGRPTEQLIPDVVSRALDRLPIPKRMRWGSRSDEFVRPVHWVVLLFGDQVVNARILGVQAGRETRGHRFHHPAPLYLAEPQAYAPLLESEGRVIADLDDRREAVRAQVLEAAAALGGQAEMDPALLDEVAALVEWPVAITGRFEEKFLKVPAAALTSSMQGHQRYFPVRDAEGGLMPYFIAVANIESKEPQAVRAGNERVIRPRLEDAKFFFEKDLVSRLDSKIATLKSVVFQKQLGTLHDKVRRVTALARVICSRLQLSAQETADAVRAAELSKCDLMTEMVGEFPELQGVMGREYARAQGESEATAVALDQQYMPRFAGDRVPDVAAGQVLSIADKLDTIAGIFSIGQVPSGDKDPFALRRAALGVLRTIVENGLDLDLAVLVHTAAEPFAELRAQIQKAAKQEKGVKSPAADVETLILDFMMDRLRAYYHEQGVRPDEFEAVAVRRPTRPYDFDRRLRGVVAFRKLPEAESLEAANKRIHNILKQAGDVAALGTVDSSLLHEQAEQILAAAVREMEREIAPDVQTGEYETALRKLAGLREPVDRFFDSVMVMAEDERLRNNRTTLVGRVRALFLEIADLSQLQG